MCGKGDICNTFNNQDFKFKKEEKELCSGRHMLQRKIYVRKPIFKKIMRGEYNVADWYVSL